MLKASILALGLATLADAIASPHKIALKSRSVPKGQVSALRRRSLSPVNDPLQDFFLGTDLQWYGNISVGTPPQNVSVVFDTGSSQLEFASTQCGPTCANQTSFDPSKSSTFTSTGKNTTLYFATGVGVTPVIPQDCWLEVVSAQDSVSVAGLTAHSVSLWTIVNQSASFDIDPFSGIQGMSSEAQGFFAGLIAQGLPAVFGMYLTSRAVGNAELTIGGYDSTKFEGNITYSDIVPKSGGFWELPSSGTYVNNETTSILQEPLDIIFDSGTSNIVFDTNITEAMYSLISPDIQPYASEPGAYGIACSALVNLSATLAFTFTAQSGARYNLTIPTSELNVGPFADNATHCQTLINAFDGVRLLGGSVLKHYYSVWDIGNQRMGFGPSPLLIAVPSSAGITSVSAVVLSTLVLLSQVVLIGGW